MLICWDNEETAFENAQHWRKNTVRKGGGGRERGEGEGERKGRGEGERKGRGRGRERERGGREGGEGEGERKGRGEGEREGRERWGGGEGRLEALRGIHNIWVQSDGTSSNQFYHYHHYSAPRHVVSMSVYSDNIAITPQRKIGFFPFLNICFSVCVKTYHLIYWQLSRVKPKILPYMAFFLILYVVSHFDPIIFTLQLISIQM